MTWISLGLDGFSIRVINLKWNMDGNCITDWGKKLIPCVIC